MDFKQLEIKHTKQFCSLIIDMYSHLQNLEWFTPMPYDEESVQGMILNPRFFILGAFENNELCAVSSLDYKCGKLIGKIDLPQTCSLNNTVEIGFNIVKSNHQGKGLMKVLVKLLLDKVKKEGFKYTMSKVHQDNIASWKSLLNNNFEVCCTYTKPVKKEDFISLSSQPFFSTIGKQNAKNTLSKY
ncbi:MAG: GNAT family N-acetyltransferase, partial [Clostridia bacterium]|nr:GNAT family N-acetyltransferase [Clostridia bacterium]